MKEEIKQECINILKERTQEHKEEFLKAKYNYFVALAVNDTNNDIGKKAKTKVLQENNFKISNEWKTKHETRGFKEEENIKDPIRDHLMTTENFKDYCKLVHKERLKMGLNIPDWNLTADYLSRPFLVKTKKKFLRVALKILPDELQKEFKPIVESYHYKHTERFLELSLRMEVA